MRRSVSALSVVVVAAIASVSLLVVADDSKAAPPPSEGGPSQGSFTKAKAGPNEPSLVADTPPPSSTSQSGEEEMFSASGKVTRRDVVRRAKRFLGHRYKYATCTTSLKSCTCVTKRTWAAFGHKLPMTERGQWRYTPSRKIARKDLRPGDIVFFKEAGKSGPITHVGIYSGNGNIVHASNYFGKVVESKMKYISGYHGAKRLRPR